MIRSIEQWVCLAAMLCSAQGLATPPNFEGVYRSDEFGQVEFKVHEGGRVSGRHYGGGKCPSDGRRVIEGVFEGSTLVGRVLLCQSGLECHEDFFEFVAFFEPGDRTLVADIKATSGGCTAPSLALGRWLKLKAEDRRVPKLKPEVVRRNDQMGADALRQGMELTRMGNFAEARKKWLTGLSVYENSWVAYLGLGISEIRLSRVHLGLEALEQAKELAERGSPNAQHSLIYFNMACGHALIGESDKAFHYLRETYRLGAVSRNELESQKDLLSLREDAKQWDEIVSLAQAKATTAKNDK